MRHEFTHEGQRYAVEVPDDVWVTKAPPQALDAMPPADRNDAAFVRNNLVRLETVARTAIAKGLPASWQGKLLKIEPLEVQAPAPVNE
jgi:hypothetical protein